MTTDLAKWLYANTSMQKDDANNFVRWLTDEQRDVITSAIDAAYDMGCNDTKSLMEPT